MRFTGTYFVEDGVGVNDLDTIDTPILLCFDGVGGLQVAMSEDVAQELRFQLDAVLAGRVHDGLQ